MNWYKEAKLETFQDRNNINDKINTLKTMAQTLMYLKKYVFQNAPHAKKVMEKYYNHKFISSYPDLKNSMISAAEIALDNYKKFAIYCDDIIDKIVKQVKILEDERKEFSTKYAPKKMKDIFKHE